MTQPALTRRLFLTSVSSVGLASAVGCAGEQSGKTASRAAEGTPQSRSSPSDLAWRRAQEIVDGIAEPNIPDAAFSIVDFGATDGAADSRPAALAAIAAASEAGGGRVIFPKGLWEMDGPLHLKSKIALHLEEGAHVRFSGRPDAYLPLVFTRWEGTEVYNYSPFIYGRDLEDIAITGPGKIDGQGAENFLPWRKQQKPSQNKLRQQGIDGVPVDERVYGPGEWLRPQFIQFVNCRRILIDGPRIFDSPFWVIHPVYCDHVTVRNVYVKSDHINSDGVDPDSSANVLIENCEFDVGDDGVALKAGRDQDGWRVAKPTRRVVIRNNRYSGNTGGALAIGSEMSGGVEEVFVENFTMQETHHGLYFKANLDRGGRIRDVHIRNIEMASAGTVLIFTNDYHSYRGGNYPTTFEDVTVKNVRCDKTQLGVSVVGHPDAPVRNVYVEDLTINAADTPLRIDHVKDLQFENVMINGEPVEAVDKTAPETFEIITRH